MKPLRTRLDLTRHCIETAIRRRHSRLVRRALRSMAFSQPLEEEIELLKNALEMFDFAWLRTFHPELAGGGAELVELEKDGEGNPRIRINGRPVEGDR